MKDDVSMMVLIAAEKGEAEVLQYLLSSYGDLIDINKQDNVNDVALSPYLPYLNSLLVWKIFFASSYSQPSIELCLLGNSP